MVKIKEEFLCEDCLQKGIASGEIELSQVEQEQTSVSFYKNIKNNECDLFNRIYFMAFSTGPFIHNLGFDEISISGSELGLISIVMLGSIFQSVLVFCGIWVFILLVETVIKIYEK